MKWTHCFFSPAKWLLWSLLLLFSVHAPAQNKDSLRAVINAHKANDTVKSRLLSSLADLYEDENIDTLISISNANLELSNAIHFERGRGAAMQHLGLAYLRMNENEKAFNYDKKALEIFEKIGYKTGQAQIFRSIADIFYRKTKYDSSIVYYNKAIAVSESIHDPEGLGLALTNIAGVYSDQSNYLEALNYYFKGLKVFEAEKYNGGTAMTLINIATIYSAMGDTVKALEYINKSQPLTRGIDKREIRFSNLVNAGVVYGQLKQQQNALVSFREGMAIADSLGDKTWKNVCLVNTADIYFQMKQYDTAYAIYREVLKENEELKDTSVIAIAKMTIGNILINKGRIDEGIREIISIFDIVLKKQMRQQVYEGARDLSNAYEQKHDYAKALKYHKIYYDYRDSLNNEQSNKRIQQVQFDYELGKKQDQIELLNKSKLLEESKSDKQRVIIWASLTALALLIVITILLYRNILYERKTRKTLSEQKEEIQEQALRLQGLNKFKDTTFSVLSHDLAGPLGAFSSTMDLLDEQFISHDDFDKIRPALKKQLNSLNSLLDSLLKWATGHMKGEMAANPETVNVPDVARRNISLFDEATAKKKIKVVNNIAESTQVFCDRGQFDIVTRNLILNAIKYTPEHGTITVNAVQDGSTMKLTVADTGIGMTAAQVSKLFTSSPGNLPGTAGEKGLGMGLMLCYDFIKANKGTISVTSEPGKGSTFVVTLPACKAS
jgi:signal transduction histidine kinase